VDRHTQWDIPEVGYCLGLLFVHISLMHYVVISTTIAAAVRGCSLEDRGEEYLEESVYHRRMEG